MARIIWHLEAQRELDEYASYIARDSERDATRWRARMHAAVETLRDFPESGRVVPEYGDRSIREVIVDNYRVIYRFRAATVRIVAVSRGTRRLRPLP